MAQPNGPTLITRELDVDTNKVIQIYEDVVEFDSPYSPTDYVVAMRENKIDDRHTRRIVAMLEDGELPETYSRYKEGSYDFPALVFGLNIAILALTVSPNRGEVQWYPNWRPGFTIGVTYRIEVSFSVGNPGPDEAFLIRTNDLMHRGPSWSMNLTGCLNDAFDANVDFSIAGPDQQWGELVDSQSFEASIPTATEYQALIGDEVLVSTNIDRWKGNIFIKQNTYLVLV